MWRNSGNIKNSSLFPANLRWLAALGITSVMAMGTGVIYVTNSTPAPTPVSQPLITKVNALGRLQPAGEVIKISAPSDPNGGGRVAELLVKEGKQVRAGEVIAILDNRYRWRANLKEAQQQVRVAKSRLAQVQAGAKQGEILAKKATVKNLQAQ